MQIDPRMVKWDEAPSIPVGMVKWDPEPTIIDKAKQAAGNLAAGAVRGAGSIGATLVDAARTLGDSVTAATPQMWRPEGIEANATAPRGTELRSGIDGGLRELGAQPESLLYKGGKLGAEIAGTAGVGGLLAKPLAAAASPLAQGVARGLQTGGFRVGPLAGTKTGAAVRAGTGVAVGGTSAGLVNPEDALLGAAIGGALPGFVKGAGTAAHGAYQGVRKAMGGGSVSPEVAQLAQRAEELGVRIPADRLVDSKPLNAVAAGLNYVPFSGRAATEDAMGSQLNKALSRTFGQDSTNVTMALRKADDALGAQFDDFLRSNAVKVDRQFLDDLAEASEMASRELGNDGASIIRNQVAEITAKGAHGQIDGQAAYNIKKVLDRIGKRNSPEAWYAIDLKGKLMAALDRSVGAEKAGAFKTLRSQYGTMLDLQKLATNGVEGEISVARLANMRNIKNPQVQEIADIAAQFVKPREGQHGAAQRALVGAAGAYMGGLPGLALGATAGRAANAALNSSVVRRGLLSAPTQRGLLTEPEALGLLTQGAYRTAPLLDRD